MQVGKLLQKTFQDACNIHQKRLNTFLTAAEVLSNCSDLSVVGLGRGLINRYRTKSNINRMDRLVGNTNLFADKFAIYSALNKLIIPTKSRPRIIVDWSSASVAERYQVLRAAVALEGRSLTVYEEVHPLESYSNPQVHKQFLIHLKSVLPDCEPIIITDAGFGVPWFKEVLKMGWAFIGRVINKSFYRKTDHDWLPIEDLLLYKSTKINSVGAVSLTKNSQFECYLEVFKGKHKERVRKNVYGDKASRSVSKRCQKSARNAWVIAHSLGCGTSRAKQAIKLYANRMQIEESFRDIKNPKYGFGLRNSRSLGVKRITNLLLIGLVATLIAWLVGLYAKREKMQYGFQTNSIKHRNVLSVFFLGLQIIKHKIRFTKNQLLASVAQIKELACVY